MRFILVFCCMVFFLPSYIAHGQITNITGGAVSITLDPQFPNPGEPVNASLDDYSINSSGSSISWYFDGHELPDARNKRNITVSSDVNGGENKLEARLSFSNKPSVSATASIKPIYLDVIIEPQTYVPIFYAGRPLPVFGSTVNLIALIQTKGVMIDPAQYSYSWQLNGKTIYGGPQQGNNRAQITIPYGLASTLTLSVQDRAGITIGRRLISIPSVPVDLEFYEESTLYGLGRKAIGEKLRLVGNNSTVRAVPYYLDTATAQGSNLMSEWRINGQKNTAINSDPFEINLRREGVGEARISFKFRNLTDLLQGDEGSFTVTY